MKPFSLLKDGVIMTNTTEHERDLVLEDFAAALTETIRSSFGSGRSARRFGFGVEPLERPGPNDPGDDRRKPTLEADAGEWDFF
jgi:hypothetical protein